MKEAPESGRPAGAETGSAGAGRIPLSVAIIVKDEAAKIRACLASVSFADQIVVVDSGSVDGTPEVARALGCEVWEESWHGFGPQKQIAVDRCRNDWILVLDADERIPPETRERIRRIVLAPPGAEAGYGFSRKNLFRGKWIRHGGWWPDRIVRLFRRGRGRMSDAPVHESVLVDGPVAFLPVSIEHETEDRLDALLRKIDRYSTLGAAAAFAGGRRAGVPSAFFRAAATFLQAYLLRGGFRDGPEGLLIAVTDAVNKFFKFAKLHERVWREGRRDGSPRS